MWLKRKNGKSLGGILDGCKDLTRQWCVQFWVWQGNTKKAKRQRIHPIIIAHVARIINLPFLCQENFPFFHSIFSYTFISVKVSLFHLLHSIFFIYLLNNHVLDKKKWYILIFYLKKDPNWFLQSLPFINVCVTIPKQNRQFIYLDLFKWLGI